jgi:hypothetical protein
MLEHKVHKADREIEEIQDLRVNEVRKETKE